MFQPPPPTPSSPEPGFFWSPGPDDVRDYDKEDLVVGLIGGTLMPIVGVILGVMLIRRGYKRGWWPLAWSLFLILLVGAAALSA